FGGTLHQVFRRDYLIHQSHAVGFFGAENPSGEQQVARMFLAHLVDQKSRDVSWYEADAYLGVSELGFRRAYPEAASGSDAGTAGAGGTIDGRDRGRAKVMEGSEALGHGA